MSCRCFHIIGSSLFKPIFSDTTLYYENFGQEILEWTDVLGVSQTATTTTQNDPQSGYTQTTYGDLVVAYSAANVGHTVPVHETVDLVWFGITAGTVIPGSPSSPPSSSSALPSSSSTVGAAPTGVTAAHWAQCGG